MAPTPRRAAIYCRLSYAPDGSVEKVDRQETDCRELGSRLRWPVSEAHVFKDNSRSAWQRNRKRPGWDQLLAAVDASEIDAIIVYHGDRLIRQPYDLEKLIWIADSKAVRISSVSGTRNLDDPDDRFILRIEAAQACKESDNTSRRVRRGMDSRLQRGLTQGGGRRPFGWGPQTGTRTKVDRETGEETAVPIYDTTQQVPAEAKLLLDAAERILAGQSQAGVVRWLTEQGSRSTEGGPWTTKALRQMLLSPRIAGLIDRGGVLYEAAWDGIVSRETWEDLQSLYERAAKEHPYPGRERKYLLSGVAECPFCQATVRTKPSGGRNRKTSRIYFCPVCKRIGRNVEHVDRYVEGKVLRLLSDPGFIEELHRDDERPSIGAEIASLERRKAEVQTQLENLADEGDIDVALVGKSLASFDRKIGRLRGELAQTSERRLLLRMVDITPQQWANESMDVRAATVRALFRIIIKPTTHRGPGFDTDSIDVIRRPLTVIE